MYGAATGDSRRWFYRYSISGNSWEALANTTADQGEGNAITWVSTENCVYATIGGEQRPTYFMRYDPSTDSWNSTPANPPAGMGDGASLVWTGDDYLYVLRGEFLETEALYDFWRYSLTDNSWAAMADIPALPHSGGSGGVGDGGSLLYVGHWLPNQSDYIYALSGNQAHPDNIPDNRTYRYTISTDSWERLADLPFGVGYYVGCRLGYADGYIYAWQGTPSTWPGGGDDLAKYDVSLEIRDLSVNAWLLAHEVYFGQNATLIVTIRNEGTQNEQNPLVNIRLNSIINDNITFTGTIEPGESVPRRFGIVTNGAFTVIEPENYTIRVEVYPLLGEVNIADNVCSLNFTVMQDYQEPQIGTPTQAPPPDNVQQFQNVNVRVNVTDYESQVRNVTLYYTNDTVWYSVPMVFNTTNLLWEAAIPGHAEATQVKYRIVACDNAGNMAVEDHAGQYYIYTVIPEFPLAIILPLLMILSAIAVAFAKKKHSKKTRT